MQTFPIPYANRIFGWAQAPIVVITGRRVKIGLLEIPLGTAGKWRRRHFWFWVRIEYTKNDETITRFLLRAKDAGIFLQLVSGYRTKYFLSDKIAQAKVCIDRWRAIYNGYRYIPRHEIEAWIAEASPIGDELAPHLDVLKSLDKTCPSVILGNYLRDPLGVWTKQNDQFVASELSRRKPWFDSFPQPPTPTQREIAIRDETNTLVVAGAGTGKTSAIITKIRYLLETEIAKPADILVLAFNAAAADEIRERCKNYSESALTVLTFHALGLKLLGDATREKPPVLAELTTDESRESVIEKLIVELCRDKKYAERYSKFLFLYPRPLVDRFSTESEQQFTRQTKASITRSMSGDWVRSMEELRIADWLYAHGIDFTYEGTYPHNTSGATRTRYRPDFTIRYTITDQDGEIIEKTAYLEHQALNESGEAPPWMLRYTEKVAWVRSVHRKYETTLIESYSWWFKKGIWEEKLKAVLKHAGISVPDIDWRKRLAEMEKSSPKRFQSDRKNVLGLIRRVLDLIRCTKEEPTAPVSASSTALSLIKNLAKKAVQHLNERLTAAHIYDAGREELFEQIFYPIQKAHEDYKRKRQGIDFEDMIFQAREVVKTDRFQAPWSHYIVDEFQDASLSRLELVQALRKQRHDSRLLCIGDDWQAIIRFAGGDIRVMTQFGHRIGTFWQANLEQTFRYSPVIAEISSSFITANPDQIKKSIIPVVGRKNLPVRIVFSAPSKETSEDPTFNDVLFTELTQITKIKPNASVLLLSRYRRGIPHSDEQASIRATYATLDLTWATVHSSKGREADAVIVSDLDDDTFGFPCLREDDPIIRRYLPPEDRYEHAEERRLFYVAMTRAKIRLTLIANAHAPSPFIDELIQRHPAKTVLEVIRSGDQTKACPECMIGILVALDGANGRFYSCSKSPVCRYKEEACPKCRQGFLQNVSGRIVCSKKKANNCDYQARICPQCESGWLVVKTNRRDGNQFMGCSRYTDEECPCKYTENI